MLPNYRIMKNRDVSVTVVLEGFLNFWALTIKNGVKSLTIWYSYYWSNLVYLHFWLHPEVLQYKNLFSWPKTQIMCPKTKNIHFRNFLNFIIIFMKKHVTYSRLSLITWGKAFWYYRILFSFKFSKYFILKYFFLINNNVILNKSTCLFYLETVQANEISDFLLFSWGV